MVDEKLIFKMPKEFVRALNRRHNGDQNRSHSDRARAYYLMEGFYKEYLKWKNKEINLLDIEWEEKEIEKHFESNLWYNAHRRLKRYRNNKILAWKRMFTLLLEMDGNSESFSEHHCISADEIYYDFKEKYTLGHGGEE